MNIMPGLSGKVRRPQHRVDLLGTTAVKLFRGRQHSLSVEQRVAGKMKGKKSRVLVTRGEVGRG